MDAYSCKVETGIPPKLILRPWLQMPAVIFHETVIMMGGFVFELTLFSLLNVKFPTRFDTDSLISKTAVSKTANPGASPGPYANFLTRNETRIKNERKNKTKMSGGI